MSRTKVVSIGTSQFELRRLPPEEGSFIFMRMLGISMRMRADAPQRMLTAEEKLAMENAPKATGEDQVRALAFHVTSGAITFEDFKFIQRACVRCVSVFEEHGGQNLPMPILIDTGEYAPAGAAIAQQPSMLVRLMTEVLVFCFADFFDGKVPGL